jgi:Flp pilus assembly pilin Flp
VRRVLRRLIAETDGQDIVEYALVALLIALAGMAGISAIHASLKTVYETSASQVEELSCMPDPGGGGCP